METVCNNMYVCSRDQTLAEQFSGSPLQKTWKMEKRREEVSYLGREPRVLGIGLKLRKRLAR